MASPGKTDQDGVGENQTTEQLLSQEVAKTSLISLVFMLLARQKQLLNLTTVKIAKVRQKLIREACLNVKIWF